MQKIISIPFIIIFLSLSKISSGQSIDSTSFELFTRYSFYSVEKTGELLLHVPSKLTGAELSLTVKINEDTLAVWNGKPRKNILRIPFEIKLKPSVYQVIASIDIRTGQQKKFKAITMLTLLTYKPNEVKTDRLTGGLLVNRLPFFPFGFYCYSPVDSTLPEEEAVRGFNMISPYQKILPETLSERKAYMDRCAQIGMKVHFNLLSVSGGGGVGSMIEGIGDDEKTRRLIDEIIAFRDHPALLGWYIADEPNGYKIPPADLEKIYNIVRVNDPWHPVSIVFMAPFNASKNYSNALDIVMADPYPLPELPASMVGNVAGDLREEFKGKRPVWIVPQAFGGGELWSREPTMQEIRSMTWQSIINGATGIQYFVRQGPNYFPKSASTWNECGRMAVEIAELTPWLLSDEETFPVETSTKDVLVTSRFHDGYLCVMAVSRINQPLNTTIKITGISVSRAKVVFENRDIAIKGGIINDFLAPFGSQVYMIKIKDLKAPAADPITNLLLDPGFEDPSSPGIPSACYARPGGDLGATYFLDSREHFEGNHSLRLITPEQDKSVTIRFFPIRVKAGSTYMISLWAKSDPEQRFRLPGKDKKRKIVISEPQYVDIFMGESHAWFVPGKEWRQYVTFVTIPVDSPARFKSNLILRMPGQGVAWFDQIRVIEEK